MVAPHLSGVAYDGAMAIMDKLLRAGEGRVVKKLTRTSSEPGCLSMFKILTAGSGRLSADL